MDEWYLVVAAPTGSVQAYPKQEDLRAFRIPHGVYVKMHKVWPEESCSTHITKWLSQLALCLHMCVLALSHGCISTFVVDPDALIGMLQATWHAGPLFTGPPHMDFYNLELSDTNQVDHNTHVYADAEGVQFEVVDA